MALTSLETVSASLDIILNILAKAGLADYVGEPISQLEHSLQSAHWARKAGAPDHAVIAALLHDVGHLQAPANAERMADLGVVAHEKYGSEFLAGLGFGPEVCALVLGHVEAKRYLVFRNTAYFQRLSDASRQTLGYQGGPMDAVEAARFEADPLFKLKLALREWDERAKIPNLEMPDLDSYRPLLRDHLLQYL